VLRRRGASPALRRRRHCRQRMIDDACRP
jgi:hypothetical protein